MSVVSDELQFAGTGEIKRLVLHDVKYLRYSQTDYILRSVVDLEIQGDQKHSIVIKDRIKWENLKKLTLKKAVRKVSNFQRRAPLLEHIVLFNPHESNPFSDGITKVQSNKRLRRLDVKGSKGEVHLMERADAKDIFVSCQGAEVRRIKTV